MRPSPDSPLEISLDEQVHTAFATWDESHRALAPPRTEYDAAMQAFERDGGRDPVELREKLRQAQSDCDRLFFKLLRVAEDRTRERYI